MCGGETATEANLGFTAEQSAVLQCVPFFLSGESLGGAQAVAQGLRLQEEKGGVAERFAGVCLVSTRVYYLVRGGGA